MTGGSTFTLRPAHLFPSSGQLRFQPLCCFVVCIGAGWGDPQLVSPCPEQLCCTATRQVATTAAAMPSRRNTKRPPPCAESCAGLCSGDAWWLWNCLASPFVLIVNCLRYLLFPFFYVLLHRITRTIFCGCCRALCPSLIRYNDKKFPKGPESIIDMSEPPVGDNEFAGMDRSAIDSKVDWVRADTLLRERRVKQKREGARAVVGGMDDALNDHFQLFENGRQRHDRYQDPLERARLVQRC